MKIIKKKENKKNWLKMEHKKQKVVKGLNWFISVQDQRTDANPGWVKD